MNRVRTLTAVAFVGIVGIVCLGAPEARGALLGAALGPGKSPAAHGIATASTTPSGFTLRSGAATDVAVGADGAAWVIGTNSLPGGFGIWRWTGGGWAPASGGAVNIAVDPLGNPWVVNSSHQIFVWNGARWDQLPGGANEVGVGANGSAWVIGTNRVHGGFGIWHWTGTLWASVSGGAVRISVGPHGDPWVVNSYGQIDQWNGTGWALLPGRATDVAVGANGSAWVVGTNSLPGGFGIWDWAGSTWASVPGSAVRISVDPHGNPWVVNSSHQIWSFGPINPAGGGAPGTIRPVGSLASAAALAGVNPASLSVRPQAVGDLMLLGIEDSNATLPIVSHVAGGGVSSWTLLANDPDATYTQDDDEIWEGVVATPGPSTITVTLNGFSDGDDLVAQEFTAGSDVTWSFDKSGQVTGTDAQDFSYPSLTPAGSAELYFGMANAINNTQLVSGGTPGVTYVRTGLECVSLVAYNTDTSNTLAPAVVNSSGSGNVVTALAVLIRS